MSQIAIRQSGGSCIVSIPKAVISSLGLQVGSHLELAVKGNKIVLTPAKETLTLEEILKESPTCGLVLKEEDKIWLDEDAVGKEE